MIVRGARAGAWVAMIAACGAPAKAQEPAPRASPLPDVVILGVAPCEGVSMDVAGLLGRMRVELLGDGIGEVRLLEEGGDAAGVGVAVVRIAAAPCAPEAASFDVAVEDRVTRKQVRRVLDLAATASESRPRALALAVAELLRASWAELAVDDPPPEAPPALVEAMRLRWLRPRPEPVRDWAPRPPSIPRRTPDPALTAAFVVRSFPAASAAPLGGRAAIEMVPTDSFVVRVDVEVVTGRSFDPLGEIELGLGTVGIGGVVVASLADVLLAIGPRLSGGVAWVRGDPADAETTASDAFGAAITAGGTIECDVILGRGWSLRFGAEVAGVILGLDATVGMTPVAGVSGPALGVWTGIARSL